jgi:hypothetical protein
MPSDAIQKNRFLLPALLSAAMIVVCGGALPAQPRLNIKQLHANWPNIEVLFYTSCNGQRVYPTDKRLFRVRENGIEIRDFEFWSSNPIIPYPCSVALVIDAGASMTGAGIFDAKMAAHALLSLLDSTQDEASVLSSTGASRLLVGTGLNVELMHRAVRDITPAGASKLWDAACDGLNELINNGINSGRSLILYTNGQDDGSASTMDQVIALANRNRIRVMVLATGNVLHQDSLKRLADLTGGNFILNPNQVQLQWMYSLLTSINFGEDWGDVISYLGSCPDGAVRTVEITLRDYCGGADTRSKSYKAPLDSSARTPIRIGCTDAKASPDSDVGIALQLLDSLVQGTFGRARVHIRFDTLQLRFRELVIPAGTPLDKVPFTVARVADGIILQTSGEKIIDLHRAPATLAELTFHTPILPGGDTLTIPVNAEWEAQSGCFAPVAQGATIHISRAFLKPPRIVAKGPAEFCAGGEVTLEVDTGYTTYSWSNGGRSRSIAVRDGGAYTVTLSDASQRTATSLPFSVAVYPTPAPKLYQYGPLQICAGDSVLLGTDYGFASYEWNTGQTGTTLAVKSSGIHYVTVRDTNGCAGVTDTLVTMLLPAPPLPVITQQGNVLETQAAPSLAWYRNGLRFYGETDRTLLLQLPGTYTVTATNEYGCSRSSAPFAVTVLAVDPLSQPQHWSFTVYPDPARNNIEVRPSGNVPGPLRFTLLDLTGRVLDEKELFSPQLHATLQFDLRWYASGVYFIVARSGAETVLRKFSTY